MWVDDYRRFIVAMLLVLGALFVWGRAHAIDTSQCGFLKCEQVVANYNAQWGPPASGCWKEARCVSASDGGANSQTRYRDPNHVGQCNVPANNPWVQGSHFAPCACASQPPIGGGNNFANSSGQFCRAGCLYKPPTGAPVVCLPANLQPGAPLVCSSEQGWTAPGTNCDPVTDPQPTPAPPNPSPLCDAEGHCIQPLLPPPPDIPKICGTGPEGDRGCAPLPGPGCGSGAGGYTCTGNPPPPPPPPPPPIPPNPPMTNPPPDFQPPGVTFNGGPIGISTGGPPYSAPCPAGTHGTYPNCTPDANPCPDGSQPVNGQCPAPPGNCPDGSHPVNGQCNAPPGPGGGTDHDPDGTCPDGTTEYNGICYGNCPGGLPPTQGMCPPQVAPCPSGATPVNGMCPVGEPCDPATDPNHCENGNTASGGDYCTAAPACSGDMILCNSNFQIWKTRCVLERINPSERPGSDDYGPSFTQAQAWGSSTGDGGDGSTLDAGGWLGGNGQCPSLPTVSFMGHAFATSEWVPCSALGILSTLILIGAYVQAAYIIGGRG